MALGRQMVVEFYDCDKEKMDDLRGVEQDMMDAAIASGATIVEKVFHRFSPWGISGVVVIAESHLAIHTWPEYGYAAVDLFTCGDEVDPMKGFELLKERFDSKNMSVMEMKRGMFADPAGRGFKPQPADTVRNMQDYNGFNGNGKHSEVA
jgi:S-adenosylmethionine decarboxylase proenzyme